MDVYIRETAIPTMSTIRETTTGMLELRLISVSTVTLLELRKMNGHFNSSTLKQLYIYRCLYMHMCVGVYSIYIYECETRA